MYGIGCNQHDQILNETEILEFTCISLQHTLFFIIYLMVIVEFPMGSLLTINKKINDLGWKMN